MRDLRHEKSEHLSLDEECARRFKTSLEGVSDLLELGLIGT